jgi:NAD(P)H-dependent FMN reductase
VTRTVRVVGLGGSLRAASTSLTALKAALEGATAFGAEVQLISVRDLGLPLYTSEHATPAGAHDFADAVYRCDALIWSSPTYHGSVSGSFKNALDWLILLAERDPLSVEQADRAGFHGRRGARAAGGQLDGVHRPRATRLERSAGAARATDVAIV